MAADKEKKQLEIPFAKPDIPIRYQFNQPHLEELVRGKIAKIVGNPNHLPWAKNTERIREKIRNALFWHDLKAEFKNNEIVIQPGPKDITGEYYEGWEQARRRG